MACGSNRADCHTGKVLLMSNWPSEKQRERKSDVSRRRMTKCRVLQDMRLGDLDPVPMTLDHQRYVHQVRLHAGNCLHRQLYPVHGRPITTPHHLGDSDRGRMTSTPTGLPGVRVPSAGIAIHLQDEMLGTVPHGGDHPYRAMDTEQEVALLRAAPTLGLLGAHQSCGGAEAGHLSGTRVVGTGSGMTTELATGKEDSRHCNIHIQPSRLLVSAVLAPSAGV